MQVLLCHPSSLLEDHIHTGRIFLFLWLLGLYHRRVRYDHCTRESVYEVVVLSVREGLEFVFEFLHIPLYKYRSSSEPSVESGYDTSVLLSHRLDFTEFKKFFPSLHFLHDRIGVHFLESDGLYTVLHRLPVVHDFKGIVWIWFSLIMDV